MFISLPINLQNLTAPELNLILFFRGLGTISQDLINLPVGTVINTPYVAQNFAASDVGGDYILFGDQRQYFPKIQLYKVSFSPVLVQEISQIFDTDCFQHRPLRIRMRGNQWRRTQESIEEKAWNAWESSPVAFQEVLEKTIKGEYEVEFILTQAERTKVLTPVLQKLKKITGSRDGKLKNLLEIIKKFHSEKHKILIFTERLATAVYLEEWLSLLLPHIRIANTVKRDQNSTFSQKDFGEIRELIVGFAPQSNQRSTISEDKYLECCVLDLPPTRSRVKRSEKRKRTKRKGFFRCKSHWSRPRQLSSSMPKRFETCLRTGVSSITFKIM